MTRSARGQADSSNAAQRHSANFKPYDVSADINRMIALAVQHDTPTNVAAFFGNRASLPTIRSWRNGNRTVPVWALEMLEQRGLMLATIARETTRGRGKRAGLRNQPHEIRQR